MNATIGCLGNTIKVAAGHYLDLANPDPETIDLKSVAAALGKICRYGGHVPRFYSVAEHSVLALELARQDGCSINQKRAILLHDAAEAFIGDVVKPLKIMLPDYKQIERRMEQAVGFAFDVDFERHAEVVKRYDLIMLKAEKQAFWPEDRAKWTGFDAIPDCDVEFEYFEPAAAEQLFISNANLLGIR